MDFLLYITNPKKVVSNFKEKYSFYNSIIDLLVVTIFIGIITIGSSSIISYFNLEIRATKFPEKTIPFFLNVVFIGPILEEFIFRAPLKQTKTSLYLFCLAYLLVGILFLYGANSPYATIIFIALTLALILIYKYRVHKTHFNISVIIYLSSFLFGLVHLHNLDFDYTSVLGAVFYVFPIFMGGLVLSYIRLRYSLLAAIIFHSLNNLISLIFLYA